MKTYKNASPRILSALALAATVLAAGPGNAEEPCHKLSSAATHRGFVIGLNAGGGGSELMYKEGTRHITEDPLGGGMGQLRVGYDLSSKFAVGLETIGFDSKEKDADWDLGAALAAVTYRPLSNGFFLRAGVGVGGGTFTDPNSGEQRSVDGRAAWLFGIGYEWRLGDHIGLGLAGDTVGFDANNVTGYEDDQAGAGGVTVQFNWYL